jgi:hypothetical protein
MAFLREPLLHFFVLEIPTPRWTAYDAKFYGVEMPPEVR